MSVPLLCIVGGSKGEIKVFHKTAGGFNEILSDNCGIFGGSIDCVTCIYSKNSKHSFISSVSDSRDFNSGLRESSIDEKLINRSGMMSLIRGSRSSLSVSASSPHRLGEGTLSTLILFLISAS